MIFNIQRFSTHDGEGIRTMIFFKGCPLKCLWCCNPESQSFGPDIMYKPGLCKKFGDCLKSKNKGISASPDGIEINRTFIQNPDEFRDLCASKALIVSGEDMSTEQILHEIEKDQPFYETSGGGVTLSGGEPLSQGPELENLLHELKKRRIDVAIETSLHVGWERIESVIDLTGTFLVDLKHTDTEKFRQFTGGEAELVLENLKKLTECHDRIIVRVPVIPGFNHSLTKMKEIIDYSRSLKNVSEIHFLPFHTLGTEKYKMLGMEYKMNCKQNLRIEELSEYVDYANGIGLNAKTGG
jgi:pyruvate formate lyase activating enzyme